MKDKIINGCVIVAMAIIANYPMYKNMQATTADLNSIITDVRAEVLIWKGEVADLQHELSNLRAEIHNEVEAVKENAVETVQKKLDVKDIFKLK